MSGLALAPAAANVIMQLSRLPVGHGVAESTVESGSLYRHPIKRTRTTLAYIMIALHGTDVERMVMRREVGRQHRNVRSSEDSDVPYNAFDPELQLWVAACMYRGFEDATSFLYGTLDPAALDELYRLSSRFATTLQVPQEMWPVDRAAFDTYWSNALSVVKMDDVTRQYLLGLASLTFLPRSVQRILGPSHQFMTLGFLPDRFREELGLAWTERDQIRFESTKRVLANVNRILPRPAREFPWNLVLWDTRRRIRSGRSIV